MVEVHKLDLTCQKHIKHKNKTISQIEKINELFLSEKTINVHITEYYSPLHLQSIKLVETTPQCLPKHPKNNMAKTESSIESRTSLYDGALISWELNPLHFPVPFTKVSPWCRQRNRQELQLGATATCQISMSGSLRSCQDCSLSFVTSHCTEPD